MALTKVTWNMVDQPSTSDANNNSQFGDNALNSLTAGIRNTAFGKNALSSVTTSSWNTAVGYDALKVNTGENNTALGDLAMADNTTGAGNVATGRKALWFNTTGNFNSAHGYGSMLWNDSGINNVAGGLQSLYCNRSGNNNVAHGRNAVYANTTGSDNIGLGHQSLLYGNGSSNIAIGKFALENYGLRYVAGSFVVGDQYVIAELGNTDFMAIGAATNDPGVIFVATGAGTGTGVASLNSTAPSSNIAIGDEAMRYNNSGSNNVAVGINALLTNSDGDGNTGVGAASLTANTDGSDNAALGNSTLYSNKTGSNNTAVGATALYNNVSGSGNVVLGGLSDGGSYTPVFDVTTENNRVVVGTTAVTNAYVRVAWTVVSDARDKTQVQPITHGLNFVNQLNPVSYKFRVDRNSEETNGGKRYGFLAQEVLTLEGNDPVIIDNEDEEHLKYQGESLVPILVKAVQELTEKFTALEKQVLLLGAK